MTKKHFERLALALADTRPERDPEYTAWRETMLAVAGVCAEANPAFDRERFFEACETWQTTFVDGVLKRKKGK